MATEQQYFPTEGVGELEALPEWQRESYSEVLAAFNEPSLWRLREDRCAECYRFLWLRTFDPAICIRIEIPTNGVGELTKKVGTGKAGFNGVGTLSLNERERLTNAETLKFLAQLQSYRIWAEPTLDDRTGLDGARWIFEAVKAGAYHVVDRWCPENGSVRTIGLKMMINLAHLKLLYEEVY